MKTSFYQFTYPELCTLLEDNQLAVSGASLLFNWHYKKKQTSACSHNLAYATQAFIKEHLHFNLPEIIETHQADDMTVKFLLRLHDGEKIEMVLIAFANKYTLCLSTQVGCAMKCSFCYTGQQGLKRHLSCDEIVTQFILAARWLNEHRPQGHGLKNIVFMGQGEPLHNFDAVKKACLIFLDQHGASIGLQKITISTAGYLPGLMRWKDEMPGVNLALSLHSVEEHKRSELIPINQKYPLNDVMAVINSFPLARKQYLIYEYLLIDNFNDSDDDAFKLSEFVERQQSKVIINLIPMNPIPSSSFQKPTQARLEAFKSVLDSQKIPTLIRGTKGDSILAACGQLNSKNR